MLLTTRRLTLPSPQKRKIESINKQRRRPLLPLSLVVAKSARESFITLRATGTFRCSHLFVVPSLLYSTYLGSKFILDLLPSPQHHASRTPQVFVLLPRRTTITLAIIVLNPGISLKNAPTLDKITPLSNGCLPSNLNQAILKMWLRKGRMHRGENLQRRWDKFFIQRLKPYQKESR